MNRLIVVDLDGTLIAYNSFRAWIRHLGRWALVTGRIRLTCRLAIVCCNRARRSMSHAQLKFEVLRLSESVPATVVDRFSSRLARSIRPAVASAVSDAATQGLTVVLATAAPHFYLAGVARAIGASATIGTPASTNDPWRETVGAEKLDRVVSLFDPDTEIALVFTDHLDDLPLVLRATQSVIVSPTPASWNGFVRSGARMALMRVEP